MATQQDPFRELVGELTADFRQLPPTARSLLAHPGQLSRAWAEGARGRYLSPVRLYLASAVVFFLIWPLWSGWDTVAELLSAGAGVAEGFNQGAGAPILPTGTEAGVVAFVVDHFEGVVLVLLLPLFTGVLREATRRRASWASCFVFALDFHSFVFLALTATVPLMALAGTPGHVLVGVAICLYLVAALRTMFSGHWRAAAWQATQVVIAYFLLVDLAAFALAMTFPAP
jgi:hypothetical protein